MRYVKTVHLNEHIRPAQYCYSFHLIPFRKLPSKRINIEGTVYNFWSFPPVKKRDYLAAFLLEKIDHFIVFEYIYPNQYSLLSTSKVYKLTDFKMETRKIDYPFDDWLLKKEGKEMNIIDKCEAGLLSYEEFQYYSQCSGQKGINEVELDKFIFYLYVRKVHFIKKNSYVGVIDKIRVIKMFPDTKIRFTLRSFENINCIVRKKELANLILFLDEGKYEVPVHGYYNSRNHLVIEKFFVRNPDSFIREFVLKSLKSIA